MDDSGVGLVTWILLALGGLVAVAGVAGGIMYSTDTSVGATVVFKDCKGSFLNDPQTSVVTVETKFPVPGIEHTVDSVDYAACQALNPGRSFVEYHIKSGRTILYESEGGPCLYDTAGPC